MGDKLDKSQQARHPRPSASLSTRTQRSPAAQAIVSMHVLAGLGLDSADVQQPRSSRPGQRGARILDQHWLWPLWR
jgi:hypothetical protein